MSQVLAGNNSVLTDFIESMQQSGQTDDTISGILSSLPFVYEMYFMQWLLRGTVSVHVPV